MSRSFVVAISGASGAIYARRLIDVLLQSDSYVDVTISPSGADVWRQELQQTIDLASPDPSILAPCSSEAQRARLRFHRHDDYFSPIASGSHRTAGMAVCPCSGQTLSAIAHSFSGNLIQRAAEVHLKEKRKLVLVTRETPLSLGQIENMAKAARSGAVVLPASPGWYHGVNTLDDLVDFIVARIADQLGLDNSLITRWGEADTSRPTTDLNGMER